MVYCGLGNMTTISVFLCIIFIVIEQGNILFLTQIIWCQLKKELK